MAEKLERYRAKRNFETSGEPSGQRKVAPAAHLRFVVQKHAARRLHYDLRLEVDGVLRSWAVTRGPSRDPKDKRLAVEVEDHPLDYGDFEGTIPEGQYGGGTVMIWDRGYWAPIDGLAPADALERGELKFVLAGEKLKGDYVLVRMKADRKGSGHPNWLLIKHRDAWARPGDREALLKNEKSVASGRTMADIAAGKGAPPRPFVAGGKGRYKADAIWLADGADPPAIRGKATKNRRNTAGADGGSARVLGVAISNPNKLLWPPPDSVSKRELAEYLASVAPWMIGHLGGRPCSLLRAPDGIDQEMFFQRHAASGMRGAISEVKIGGDRKPYLQIDDASGLVAMGQLGAVEFHPWNSAPGAPEIPGRLVFDLDPGPGAAFDAVVTTAREIRARLEAVGLVAFCKTTGGKGLHVVVPLAADRPAATWEQAKTFARTICTQLADAHPERYLIKMTKSAREGRIFLDYLRNDRTATAVAPLSPRARPGALVSMPLTWGQVRTGLDPARFSLRTAAGLMATNKPWSDYAASARSLRAAIAQLVGRAS